MGSVGLGPWGQRVLAVGAVVGCPEGLGSPSLGCGLCALGPCALLVLGLLGVVLPVARLGCCSIGGLPGIRCCYDRLGWRLKMLVVQLVGGWLGLGS